MDGINNAAGLSPAEATALSYAKIQKQLTSTLLQGIFTAQQNQLLALLSLTLQQNGIGKAVDVFA